MSEPIFSASGVRGVFGVSLTLRDVLEISEVFSGVLGEGEIVVGRDSRPSGSPLTNVVVASLNSLGRDVIDLGISPTPAIMHAVRELRAAGGVIISASHNPPEWNALKLVGQGGTLLDEPYYVEVERRIKEYGKEVREKGPLGHYIKWSPLESYCRSIIGYVDSSLLKKKPLKVAVDAGGGAGSLATPRILRALGCKVKTIHCNLDGYFPRPLEPTPEALRDLSGFVLSTASDVGFAHDCDADRMVCVTEEGSVLRPDEGFAIIVDDILRDSHGGVVVTNVASSLMIEDIAERYGAKVVRTPVGEANVVKEMIRLKAVIGGEGSSGGVIIPQVHYTRDGPLACAKMAEILSKRGMAISEVISGFTRYHLERADLPCPKELAKRIVEELALHHEGENIDFTDGIKIIGEEEWVLVRASGTEPKIRVWAEARRRDRATRLCNSIVDEAKEITTDKSNK